MQIIVLKLQGGTGSGPLQTFCKTTVDIAPHAAYDGIQSELIALPMPFTKASGFGNAAQGQPLLKARMSLKALQVPCSGQAHHSRACRIHYGSTASQRSVCICRPLIESVQRPAGSQPVCTVMVMEGTAHLTRAPRSLLSC